MFVFFRFLAQGNINFSPFLMAIKVNQPNLLNLLIFVEAFIQIYFFFSLYFNKGFFHKLIHWFQCQFQHKSYPSSPCIVHSGQTCIALQFSSIQFSIVQYSWLHSVTFDYSSVLFCGVQFSTTQYLLIACSKAQYNLIQFCAVQYSPEQFITVQSGSIQLSTVQYSLVQFNSVHFSTAQYITVEFSTIQYSSIQLNTQV